MAPVAPWGEACTATNGTFSPSRRKEDPVLTRGNPVLIEDFLSALRVLLYDRAGLSGDQNPSDLRITQVLMSLEADRLYNMEDEEFIAHVWESCD